MAGATNKSAKRLGYTKAQIQTERAKGGILSHAALLASGAPARPTKAHKALVEAMDARKQGLTRKAEPPAGWKAAARGEGAEGRAAARGAREAFVQKRDAAVKRDALVARTAKNIGDVSRIARGMQQKQAADTQAKAAADAKQAQIGRTARALGDASKIARGMRQKQAADAQAAKAKDIDSIRADYLNAARGYIRDMKEASGRRKDWTGPLVHLQTIGKTPAKKASELKTGDTLVFNGGATAKVTKVEPLSRTYMTVTTDSGYTRKYGRERLVAFDPR